MFLLGFYFYISLPVGVVAALKIWESYASISQNNQDKKILKKGIQHFHTAIAVAVSGLHWRSPFDFSGMERGWVSCLALSVSHPCCYC